MKIRPVGAGIQTNMTKVVVTVRKSANAPKNSDWRRLDVIASRNGRYRRFQQRERR